MIYVLTRLEVAKSNPIIENFPSFSRYRFISLSVSLSLSLSLSLFNDAALQLLLCGVISSSLILINNEL